MAHALMILGAVHANAEHWEDAEHALARSRSVYEQLMRDTPTDSDARQDMADLLGVGVSFVATRERA